MSLSFNSSNFTLTWKKSTSAITTVEAITIGVTIVNNGKTFHDDRLYNAPTGPGATSETIDLLEYTDLDRMIQNLDLRKNVIFTFTATISGNFTESMYPESWEYGIDKADGSVSYTFNGLGTLGTFTNVEVTDIGGTALIDFDWTIKSNDLSRFFQHETRAKIYVGKSRIPGTSTDIGYYVNQDIYWITAGTVSCSESEDNTIHARLEMSLSNTTQYCIIAAYPDLYSGNTFSQADCLLITLPPSDNSGSGSVDGEENLGDFPFTAYIYTISGDWVPINSTYICKDNNQFIKITAGQLMK